MPVSRKRKGVKKTPKFITNVSTKEVYVGPAYKKDGTLIREGHTYDKKVYKTTKRNLTN